VNEDVHGNVASTKKRLQKRWRRGVTLVEVLIVVAIMAMLAGGVAVFALPKFREAQVSTARTSALTIRTAIQDWQRINNEYSCPSISQLKQEKIIDTATETNDPWNEPFTLTCSDDEVYVASKGPDKKDGTADDVVVPKAAGEEAQ
jgi:general secretion pathway protein G